MGGGSEERVGMGGGGRGIHPHPARTPVRDDDLHLKPLRAPTLHSPSQPPPPSPPPTPRSSSLFAYPSSRLCKVTDPPLRWSPSRAERPGTFACGSGTHLLRQSYNLQLCYGPKAISPNHSTLTQGRLVQPIPPITPSARHGRNVFGIF